MIVATSTAILTAEAVAAIWGSGNTPDFPAGRGHRTVVPVIAMYVATSTATIIAAAAIVAAAATQTGLALSQGSPAPPKPAAATPPPSPPPTDTPPPPPTDTPATEDVGTHRRKRGLQFGVQETLLTSPLGGGTEMPQAPRTRSLLGG